MIVKTRYVVPQNLIDKATDTVFFDTFKNAINYPLGNFFYDPWKIKNEFKHTVWDEILKTLPYPLGEARIIVLDQNGCYSSHSDVDDRWHLNIKSKKSYLISLDTEQMFNLSPDGIWYDMDASHRHTAVNFSNRSRVQLVVRKLLIRSNRNDLVNIEIMTNLIDLEDARYEFDNIISPFLNNANKENAIDNFSYSNSLVSMSIAPEYVSRLVKISGDKFGVKIND